jgi:hypothetical protein
MTFYPDYQIEREYVDLTEKTEPVKNMFDFVKENKFPFTFIKPNENFKKEDKRNSKYQAIKFGWKEKTYDEMINYYNIEEPKEHEKKKNNEGYVRHSGDYFFINIKNSGYVVIDTDSKEAHTKFINYCNEKNIDISSNYTLSPSNHYKEHTTYKRHYYFTCDEEFKQHTDDGIDILNDTIAEYRHSKMFKPVKISLKKLNKISKAITGYDLIKGININEIKTETKKEVVNNNKIDNSNKIEDLINRLPEEVAEDYEKWRNVGFFLKPLGDDYFNLFNEFSKKSKSKYSGEVKLANEWRGFPENSKINIGTIILYLKNSNIESFNEWKNKYNDYNKNKVDSKAEELLKLKEEYDNLKTELETNKNLFYCNKSICFEKAGQLEIYNLTDARLEFAPYKIGKKKFIDLWIEDQERQSKDKIDFDPSNKIKNIYNTFKGFKYDNSNEYDINKIKNILDMIKYILNNDEEQFTVFIKWLAWIRQRPQRKTEKAVVLYSETQGVGKNTLVHICNKILDGYTAIITQPEDLLKNFNWNLCNKLLICGDEVKAKAKKMADDLKNIITRTKMNAEKKGRDAFEVNDFTNYIYTTNNYNTFHIEETDRRFYLFQCNEKPKTENEFSQFYKLFDDENIWYHFDSYLKSIQIPDDKLKNYDNIYKNELKSYSLPAYIKMIYTNYKNYCSDNEQIKVKAQRVFNDAIEYAKSNNMSQQFTAMKLSKDFKKEFGEFYVDGKTDRYYSFPNREQFLGWLRNKRPELIIDF